MKSKDVGKICGSIIGTAAILTGFTAGLSFAGVFGRTVGGEELSSGIGLCIAVIIWGTAIGLVVTFLAFTDA